MKKSMYKYLLIAMAIAITGCEDAVLSAPEGAVPENAQAGYTVTQITITNTGNSVLESLVLNGAGAENFSVDNKGLITVAEGANLDYETVMSYQLSAVATSTKGDSVTGDIIINILDVADIKARLTDLSTVVNENVPVGTLIGTVPVESMGDSAITSFAVQGTNSFAINEKGEIRTQSGMDYESMNSYEFTVSATNGAGESNSALVTVTVADIADVIPRILGFSATVKETIEIGSIVGQVTVETEGDSPITAFTISDNDTFAIDMDGVVTTKVLLDYAVKNVYTMSVVATNQAGSDTGLVEVTLIGSKAFAVKPFTAKYYYENDGTSAGQGTDGSDPSIVPVLKYTETVKRPAISYPYAYEFGIDSYNLYAEWEGEIEMYEAADINASFDVSWSDVSFYVDGQLVSKWANSNKIIPLSLSVGTHSVRVEYHNHWHTTGFNVSFTDYRHTTMNEDITPMIEPTSQINYIIAYEVASSTSRYNEVEITLPQSDRPQVLFLNSYNAINWVIKNPYNTKLEGVVFNSYGPGSTVTAEGDAFILNVSDLRWNSSDLTKAKEGIVSMTGREPEYIFNEYNMVNIEIPGL